MNSIMEGLRDYFLECPLLDESGRVGVDFLGDQAVDYVLESVPNDYIIQKYTDGGSKRQYLFVFASREQYGADVLNNLANCGFYEAFAEWLEEQAKKHNLPELPEGKMAIGLYALTSGYLFDTTPDTGRYQIQCQLVYIQEA